MNVHTGTTGRQNSHDGRTMGVCTYVRMYTIIWYEGTAYSLSQHTPSHCYRWRLLAGLFRTTGAPCIMYYILAIHVHIGTYTSSTCFSALYRSTCARGCMPRRRMYLWGAYPLETRSTFMHGSIRECAHARDIDIDGTRQKSLTLYYAVCTYTRTFAHIRTTQCIHALVCFDCL